MIIDYVSIIGEIVLGASGVGLIILYRKVGKYIPDYEETRSLYDNELMYTNRFERNSAIIGRILAAVVGSLILLWFAFSSIGLFAYGSDSYSYKPVQGTVASLTSKFNGGDDSTDQSFVIQFAGNPHLYECGDYRCSGDKVGTVQKLMCEKHWNWPMAPTFDCQWAQVK